MAEFIPVRNTPEVLEKYVTAMRAAGLAVVGGTEHNSLDLIPLEPTCVKGAPVPAAGQGDILGRRLRYRRPPVARGARQARLR